MVSSIDRMDNGALDLLHQVRTCPTELLQELIKCAEVELETRQEKRRKELWDNVRAAIQKYCAELKEDIETRGCEEEGVICLDSLDDVGVFYIAS